MTAIERYEAPKTTFELVPEAWGLAQKIANTDFVPKALRTKPEAVLACMLAGHEVGISPFQALAKIHVIDGRPAMAAELMRALVLREGHDLWIEEQGTTRCILGGKRKGSERETRVTWTMDDAKRANLTGKQNWRSYPTAMLLARATGALCRAIFPDVLAGISYTVEELEDGDLIDAIDAPPPPEPGTAPPPPRSRARARQAATRGAPAAQQPEGDPKPTARREAPLPGEEDDFGDDIAEAELVEEKTAEEPVAETPDPFEDNYEGPDQNLSGRAYSGPQVIAMRLAEFGVKDREDRLRALSQILGRDVDTSKDLSPDEIKFVLEHLNALPEGSEFVFEEGRAGESPPETSEPDPGEAMIPPPEPSSTRRRKAPSSDAEVDPDGWDGPIWRSYLAAQKVKVTEVLREADRLAREAGTKPPVTMDEIAGSGLAGDLVAFVGHLTGSRNT